MINLDNASTTEPLPEVVNSISVALKENYFNMGAKYKQAQAINKMYLQIKEDLASLLGAKDYDVVFTPSATIANNLVFSVVNPSAKKKVLVSAGEHPSVYECAKHLKESGVQVEFVPLTLSGEADIKALTKLMDKYVCLVSIMHVSNETGAINNIKEIVKLVKAINPNVLVHCDGVQACGKLPVNIKDLGVDFYTISAHKIGGPKGVGALICKQKAKLKTLIYGGGQEDNLISGTENYAYMQGFYTALKLTLKNTAEKYLKVLQTRNDLLKAFDALNLKYTLNTNLENSSPYILNLSFNKVRGEVLLHALSEDNVLIANGSACSSHKRGNRILENMGKSKEVIDEAIRISFNANYEYNCEEIAEIFAKNIKALKVKS